MGEIMKDHPDRWSEDIDDPQLSDSRGCDKGGVEQGEPKENDGCNKSLHQVYLSGMGSNFWLHLLLTSALFQYSMGLISYKCTSI